MNVGTITRPASSSLAVRSSRICQPAISNRRHESSFRRTTKRLRVKPESSFLPSKPSPQQDHIVFNPPSSAPSVYHTPFTFLPKEDRRREFFSGQPSKPSPLPKPVRRPYEKRYHLGQPEIDEIRRLRLKEPHTYTVQTLAKKFDCSSLFVSIICQEPDEHRERSEAELEATKSGWGRKRRTAREDRAKRRETWGREG
ncbi:MAG: hypothetical protein M1837_000099 [Sclerophora amabilis]|nr:MAG: hypothetical protein M1837_000099 [Sclerophora amabilis]